MQLIDDCRDVWYKLWSVRLALGAALLSALEVAWNVYVTDKAPWLALLSFIISLSAAGARVIAQPKIHADDQK